MMSERHHRPLFRALLWTWLCLDVLLVLLMANWARQAILLQNLPQQGLQAIVPTRVRIPRLQVDAVVVEVGQTKTGRMDVPRRAEEVGWFEPGTLVGAQGSAVLAGHLDSVKGPAVFWNLHKLQPGDEILVSDAAGTTLRFIVERTLIYDEAKAPLNLIFGDQSGKKLNLITCNGVWLQDQKNYNKRLVVFTSLDPDFGPPSDPDSEVQKPIDAPETGR